MKTRREKVIVHLAGNGGNMADAMRKAGYSEEYANNPQKMKRTKTFQELLDQYLPEKKVVQVHRELLGAAKIDHATFPLSMSDDEIKEVIESIKGCQIKKFKHGETATHVWYWVADNKARQAAIDMVYKLRGNYAAEKIIQVDPLKEMTDEELAAKHEEMEQEKQNRLKKTNSDKNIAL